MRIITTTVTVYTFDELTEEAQEKAIEGIREKKSGPWWDSFDNDTIGEEILYTFADKIGTPGREKFGPGDFPGITDVELRGWDLDRGQSVDFAGRLTPDNAPALPWVDGMDAVDVGERGYRHGVVCQWDYETEGTPEVRQAAEDAMEQAIRDAMSDARKAGNDAMEYMTGEESAREWIEANGPEFTEDGELYM